MGSMQSLEIELRDAHDPWIYAENVTHDTLYFGESKSDKRTVGFALLITGLVLLFPPACRAVCLWHLSKEETYSTRYSDDVLTDSPESTPRRGTPVASLSTRDRFGARSELGSHAGQI